MRKAILSIVIILLVVIAIAALLKQDTVTNEDVDIVPSTSAMFTSESETIETFFDNTNNTVTFTQSDIGTVTLQQVVSASGARYANADESIVFWEHQGEVTITHNGIEVFKGLPITEASEVSSLMGTWVWKSSVLGDDSVLIPEKVDAFTLTFTQEGQVSGTTDCNSMTGTYQQANPDQITFGPLATTRMFCENSQETLFAEELSNVSGYIVSFDTLTLSLKDGMGHMNFTRQQN